jgi:hypothetical protein
LRIRLLLKRLLLIGLLLMRHDLKQLLNQLLLLRHDLRKLLELLLRGKVQLQQMLQPMQELWRLPADRTSAEPGTSEDPCRRWVIRRCPDS